MYIKADKLLTMNKILELGKVQLFEGSLAEETDIGFLYLFDKGKYDSQFKGEKEFVYVDIFHQEDKVKLRNAIIKAYEEACEHPKTDDAFYKIAKELVFF